MTKNSDYDPTSHTTMRERAPWHTETNKVIQPLVLECFNRFILPDLRTLPLSPSVIVVPLHQCLEFVAVVVVFEDAVVSSI